MSDSRSSSHLENKSLRLHTLLHFAHQHNASDLHLSAGMPAMIRVDGKMAKIDMPALEHSTVKNLIYEVMNEKHQETYEKSLEVDFSFQIPNLARFRANAFNQHRGAAAVFRHIPNKVSTMTELDMGDVFKKIASFKHGVVLVTGPTGSGKTTTLAAIIDYINQTRKEHILTIEDPIEFIHQPKKSLITQREVKRDTHSFEKALRSALREDPDIILLGEMRDLETIRLALTAAETGHLVFATVHTSSATKTIDRIIDVFPSNEKDMIRAMLSESLRAITSQVLVEREAGGRVAVREILLATPAIRNLIRENKVAQMYSSIQTSAGSGMVTLDSSLKELLIKKTISRQTAKAYAKQPDNF